MTTPQDNIGRAAPASTELQEARKATLSLVSAFKAYSLYPPEHVFSRKNVAKLQQDLEDFLRSFPSLRLDIARNAFSCKGEVVFEGQAEENNPAYLMTRDGLLYLEFVPGLTIEETARLLNLLNKNRNPFEDPEGDIITCLWQEEFEHIHYGEIDYFTLESFHFDLSTFKMAPDAPGETAQQSLSAPPPPSEGTESAVQDTTGQPSTVRPLLLDHGMSLLTITPEEATALAAQVLAAEDKDITGDIIDVLLIILVVQENKVNFLHALEFLEYEFFETLERKDFHLSYKLLNNIQLIREQSRERKNWRSDLIENFILIISNEERLSRIPWVQDPESLERYTPYLSQLWQVLRFLAPESIMVLGPLAGRIPIENLNVRNELLEIIESKARQEPERLRDLFAKSDEQVILVLAPVVSNLVAVDTARIYLQMTWHDSVEVKKIGLDNYMQSSAVPDFNELSHLLDDRDPRIRERITSYLLQAGPETAEHHLIRSLEQSRNSGQQDQLHVIEHYRALVSCRPHAVLPFLEKVLLDSRLSDMFSNNNTVHIKAAALALKGIGTNEALAILKKGGQSMRPDIRLACQHVLKM